MNFTRRATFHVIWLLLLLALSGCKAPLSQNGPANTAPSLDVAPTAPLPVAPVQFTDITQAAGIHFTHNSGAFGLTLMPETNGSGVAFIDYDGDGYQDIFFVNSRDWTKQEVNAYKTGWGRFDQAKHGFIAPPQPPHHRTTGALYHNNGNDNNGNGTFTDVTSGSGLDVEMFGQGVAVGDYDNDGKPDLYVTAYGHNYLFHNESTPGHPHFREVAQQAGVQDSGWSSSAAWLDYDKDGLLDLFVCHYIKWTPATDRYGSINGHDKSYTPPYLYKGEENHLYHNIGHGRFVDVSARAKVRSVSSTVKGEEGKPLPGRSLGVAVCDYNNDGWPDILVANDGDPNFLFRNNHNGTFTDVAVPANVAYAETGHTRSGMGIDTGDINHSNQDSVVVGNFDAQMLGLYLNQGNGSFIDIGPLTEVGRASRTFSVFGCVFLDIDNDGWLDILTASGHISEQFNGIRGTSYKERPLLFHNDGKGNYQEIGLQSGAALQRPIVGRGLAYADIDLDGDVDVVLTTDGGPPLFLRNDGGNKNNAIRLTLQGTKSNRSAIGTLVKVKFSEQDGLRRWVRSGSSYESQSELPVTLGIGRRTQVPLITLYWPSGHVTRLRNVVANQSLLVNEARGVISHSPLHAARQ